MSFVLKVIFVLIFGCYVVSSSKYSKDENLIENVDFTTSKTGGFVDECGHCNVSSCPAAKVKCRTDERTMDHCGCCITCILSKKDDVCKTITCPKMKICIPNIQGIPMCRCPSRLSCPRRPVRPLKRLCGTDGHTYRSRCAMRVAECPSKRKIRVAHRGPCVHTEKDKRLHEKLKEKIARKTQRKAKKEEKLRRKKLRRKHRKRQQKMRAMMRTGFRKNKKRARRRRNMS